MADIKMFDRVVLTEAKQGPILIPAGTVATCREIFDNGTALFQYDWDNEKPLYFGCPLAQVRLVTMEDLDTVDDYKKLIPPIYHVGNDYLLKYREVGDPQTSTRTGTITGIQLAANEMDDIYTLKCRVNAGLGYEASVVEDYTKKQLDAIGSYAPFDMPEEVSTAEQKEPDKTIENSEDDIIKILIDGIEFSVIDDNIIIPSVNLKDIDKVVKSLNKLNKILRKE